MASAHRAIVESELWYRGRGVRICRVPVGGIRTFARWPTALATHALRHRRFNCALLRLVFSRVLDRISLDSMSEVQPQPDAKKEGRADAVAKTRIFQTESNENVSAMRTVTRM